MPIKRNNKKGFALLELVVAIGLFGIVAFISFGPLVGLFDANRKSQTIFSSMTNLNYSIESMVRTIRFAFFYHCDATVGTLPSSRDCSLPGADSFAMALSAGDHFTYSLSNGRIMYTVGSNPPVPVTGTDVTITDLKFYVAGSASASSGNPGSDVQPYVIMTVRGYSGSKPSSLTNFDIQTMVSQKKIDL